MKKVCAYTRVSTDSTDQINSLENQVKYFEIETGKRDDIKLTKIYSDEGLTGTNVNRPQFLQMLRDAGLHVSPQISSFTGKPLKNKFNYEINPRVQPAFEEIWIKNTSRFARNTLSQEIIDNLTSKGVYIYFIEQNINTRDELNRGLLLKLFQVFDEQDSKDKSLKVMQGRKTAAMRGKIISNGKLFGYDYAEHEFTINEPEAEIVREIFNLYAGGLGIRRIIQALNQKGYKTRRERNFSKSTVNRILENEKYTGDYTANIWDSGVIFSKKTPQLKPKDKWYIHEDIIPAIISKELFNKCQRIKNSKINHKNQRGVYHGTSVFAGKLICANCGSKYHSNRDRGKQFYNCSGKRKTKTCRNDNIYFDNLEKLCIREIKNQIFFFTSKEIFIKYALFSLQYKLQSGQVVFDFEALKEQEEILKEQEEKLLELYLENKIDKDIYEQKFESLQMQKQELIRKRQLKSNEKSFIDQQCREIDSYIDMLSNQNDEFASISENFEYIIQKHIKQIKIINNEKIEVEFKLLNLADQLRQVNEIYSLFTEEDIRAIEQIDDIPYRAEYIRGNKIIFSKDGQGVLMTIDANKLKQLAIDNAGKSIVEVLAGNVSQ
ncbi:MAG TPA: recombinase family protein [Methanosarcina sp.]|nr:recombinase family protein [Methanosarcina sp.]